MRIASPLSLGRRLGRFGSGLVSVVLVAGCTAPAAAPAAAPGVTDSTVTIALAQDRYISCTASQPPSCSRNDYSAVLEAMTDWANASGGIAGRELIAYTLPYDNVAVPTSTQAVCDALKEERPTFAVLMNKTADDADRSCLTSNGVLMLDSGLPLTDSAAAQELAPFYFAPSSPTLDDYAEGMVRGLEAQGFFTNASRVGVLAYEQPAIVRAYESSMYPQLRRLGFPTEVLWASDESASADDPTARIVDELIYDSPVDRLILLGGGSAEARRTMSEVTRQLRQHGAGEKRSVTASDKRRATAWFERIWVGAGSLEIPGNELSTQSPVAFPGDGSGVRPTFGISLHPARDSQWFTFPDLGPAPGAPSPTAEQACRRIFAEHNVSDDELGEPQVSLGICDQVRFLKATAALAEGDLSANTLEAGAFKLGSSFQSALVPGTNFGPGDHMGASAAYVFRARGCDTQKSGKCVEFDEQPFPLLGG